jgi:hypothetical protein
MSIETLLPCCLEHYTLTLFNQAIESTDILFFDAFPILRSAGPQYHPFHPILLFKIALN